MTGYLTRRKMNPRFTKLGLCSLVSLLITSTLTSANAESNSGVQPGPSEKTKVSFVERNAVDPNFRFSRIYLQSPKTQEFGTYCKEWGVYPCVDDPAITSGSNPWFNVNLPMCEGNKILYCVEKVEIYREGGSPTPAQLIGESNDFTVPGSTESNLPRGGGSLLFRAPGVSHSGKQDTYAVRAYVWGNWGNAEWGEKPRFGVAGFGIDVEPYSVTNLDREILAPKFKPVADGKIWPGNQWEIQQGEGALYLGKNKLATTEDFAENTRVALSVRVPSELWGWFSGRIKDPRIKIEPVSKKVERLTIDASSLRVPQISTEVPSREFSEKLRQSGMVAKDFNLPTWGQWFVQTGSDLNYGTGDAFSWVDALRDTVSDKATKSSTIWALQSSWPNNALGCFPRDGLSGIVTTNAPAYSSEPPSLNKGFLEYKVAGVHFDEKGAEIEGSYDLLFSSDVIRCIFQFSQAPINATVSIVDDSGEEKKIASTVVSERDGWLKLAAYGFTFSSPTVRVKLTQKSTLPSVKKGVAKKISIKCSKGKTVKRISGTNPKCPAGYKKN